MDTMNISKHKLKGFSVMLLLLLLTTALLPVSAFAAELPTVTAAITVEKKLTGDTPPSAETFTFTLTPENESNPMPETEPSNKITIKGAGKASFGAITYSEPGNYSYTVKEEVGNVANYTYDKSVYKVTVYVTTDDDGNLTAKVWAFKDGSEAKAANAVFTNSYKKTTSSDSPQTGDDANLPLWITLAGGSVAILLILLVDVLRKRKEHRQL